MKKKSNKAKIDLIREALIKGEMSPLTFYTIINMIVNEMAIPTKEDIEWARNVLKERGM